MWTQIRLLFEEQSDLGSHCLPVCKNRFEKFARRFSRRHIQTTFSDAGFLGVLRIKVSFLYLRKKKRKKNKKKKTKKTGAQHFLQFCMCVQQSWDKPAHLSNQISLIWVAKHPKPSPARVICGKAKFCLRMVRWFFSGYSGFRPPSMNDRLDISVKYSWKGRKTQIPKKKKKKKKKNHPKHLLADL